MRETRVSGGERRSLALVVLVAALASWLVVQNLVLLLAWSWPMLPGVLTVARTLLKIGGIVAVQMLPAVLVAAGVALLWAAARRPSRGARPRLEEVRHG